MNKLMALRKAISELLNGGDYPLGHPKHVDFIVALERTRRAYIEAGGSLETYRMKPEEPE